MKRQYKLLKDTPELKAGEIVTYMNKVGQSLYFSKDEKICYFPSVVENQPEWFKKVEHYIISSYREKLNPKNISKVRRGGSDHNKYWEINSVIKTKDNVKFTIGEHIRTTTDKEDHVIVAFEEDRGKLKVYTRKGKMVSTWVDIVNIIKVEKIKEEEKVVNVKECKREIFKPRPYRKVLLDRKEELERAIREHTDAVAYRDMEWHDELERINIILSEGEFYTVNSIRIKLGLPPISGGGVIIIDDPRKDNDLHNHGANSGCMTMAGFDWATRYNSNSIKDILKSSSSSDDALDSLDYMLKAINESSKPKPEFQIQSFISNDADKIILHSSMNGNVFSCAELNGHFSFDDMISRGRCVNSGHFKIHSVKRMSDDEVFTIGETVGLVSVNDKSIINEFRLFNKDLIIDMGKYSSFIGNLEKLTEVVSEFEDGTPIYKGDRVFIVTSDLTYYTKIANGKFDEAYRKSVRMFKTVEQANEFIKEDRKRESVFKSLISEFNKERGTEQSVRKLTSFEKWLLHRFYNLKNRK